MSRCTSKQGLGPILEGSVTKDNENKETNRKKEKNEEEEKKRKVLI